MGLLLALKDLIQQLERHGWQIDVVGAPPVTTLSASEQGSRAIHSPIDFLRQKLVAWHDFWARVSASARNQIILCRTPFQALKEASDDLIQIERAMANAQSYDLILLCTDCLPAGAVALVTERHECVALLCLTGLTNELTIKDGVRWLTRLRARQRLHPYLYQRVPVEKVELAIFPSRTWQETAIAAGLPAQVTEVAYFGVPAPPLLPRSPVSSGRLLWAGRLAYEKGLHLFLMALPLIRQQIKGATLTVVAGPWSAPYQTLIFNLIKRYHLEEVVTFKPAVPRSALQPLYAEHDILLFHSLFSEPVALVMMEAMAAGLPVVASQSRSDALLTRDQVTCLCYDPRRLETLVSAVVRLHSDNELRRSLAARAQRLVRESFSLEAMGAVYDQLLSEFVAAHREVASCAAS